MSYTNAQKTSLRKELKMAGYKCRINEKVSPFSDKVITFISFILPDGKVVNPTTASVYGEAFYRDHKRAFEIINNFRKINGE